MTYINIYVHLFRRQVTKMANELTDHELGFIYAHLTCHLEDYKDVTSEDEKAYNTKIRNLLLKITKIRGLD